MPKKMTRTKKSKRGISNIPRPIIRPVTYGQLNYMGQFAITESASGIGAYQTFRLNDLYDPDFTGAGDQPVAFDQFSILYARFRVLRVHVDVGWAKTATSGIGIVGLFPSSSSTLPANCISWPCQPYAKWTIATIGAAGSYSAGHIRGDFDLPKVMGLTRSQYMDEMDFTCTPSSSPLRSPYLHVWVASHSGTIFGARCYVRLTFEVEMSQPVTNSVS